MMIVAIDGRYLTKEKRIMRLDIRIPIGTMFVILGVLLVVFGLIPGTDYSPSLGININLWWGLVMFAFGLFMLILGRRATSVVRFADETPEGRKIEERERRTGLEQDSPRGGH